MSTALLGKERRSIGARCESRENWIDVPECEVCGEEVIRVNGALWSRHLRSGRHWKAKQKRNGQKPDDAVAGLRALGITATEARRLLRGKRGTTEERVRAALQEYEEART